MSDLDDALNTSSPMFHPVEVIADWEELPPGLSVGGLDSLRDLGQQIGPQGYTVTHSFDDGLPDPVTMTGSNDASGALEMDLVGRQANIADFITGWRNATSGFATGTTIAPGMPSISSQDYVVVAITVNGTAVPIETTYEAGHPHGWTALSSVTDATYTTYVFGRSHFVSAPAPIFKLPVSSPYSWIAVAIGANFTAGNSSFVPVKPGVITGLAKVGTSTTHTGPLADLPGRGWVLGIFAATAAAGPLTATGTSIQLVQSTGGTAALQAVTTPLQNDDNSYQHTSTSVGSTNIGMMFSIPLVIMDRPKMDALAYFSPFNTSSPIQSFDRDTAPMSASVNVISPNGPVATPVFKGQMADISVTGRTAALSAVSKTRLLLDKTLQLPTVFGRRESCTTDWLASYLMAQGGQYPGIAPSPQTRWWVPMHGSLHPFMAGANVYTVGFNYTTTRSPTGPWGLKPPKSIAGPFVTAISGKLTTNEAERINIGADTRNWATEVPGMVGEFNDIFSQQNNIGRFTFWMKGDPHSGGAAPAVMNGGADNLFQFNLYLMVNGLAIRSVSFEVRNTRQGAITMGSTTVLTGGDLPTDGLWHFWGITWDYLAGTVKIRRDGVFWNPTGFASASVTDLPPTDAIHIARNPGPNSIWFNVDAKMPIAELQLESGPTLYNDAFTRFYPTPQAPSLNAKMRTLNQWIEAIAEPAPVQGWETLNELAQSTLSHLRVNEEDNVEYLPLRYFGEAAQLTVDANNVIDTDVNAAELAVTNDPTKTRNVVTVAFGETRVNSSRDIILEVSSPISFPRGTTRVTFALDVLTAEIHGALNPYGTDWDIEKLTPLQVAGTNPIQNEHVMSVNALQDGQGVPYTGAGFTGLIVGWDSSTVTIDFKNTSGGTLWLANNGSGIPFLRILGYPVQVADGYVTARDSGSVGTRRERGLTTQMKWIQTRDAATEVAGTLATMLSQPRIELQVTVMGDPRRRPGQMVRLADAEGTRASGTWRILAVTHRGNGAMYVQDLQLVRVGESGVWDVSRWDNSVWSE